MTHYRVTWEIDIEADSHADAAVAARNHQHETTTAVVFDVTDEHGEYHQIDLLEKPDPQDAEDRQFIKAAEEDYCNDNVNIDDDAKLSHVEPDCEIDGGAWVQAWVWVPRSRLGK